MLRWKPTQEWPRHLFGGQKYVGNGAATPRQRVGNLLMRNAAENGVGEYLPGATAAIAGVSLIDGQRQARMTCGKNLNELAFVLAEYHVQPLNGLQAIELHRPDDVAPVPHRVQKLASGVANCDFIECLGSIRVEQPNGGHRRTVFD